MDNVSEKLKSMGVQSIEIKIERVEYDEYLSVQEIKYEVIIKSETSKIEEEIINLIIIEKLREMLETLTKTIKITPI